MASWGEVLPDFLLSVSGAGLADKTQKYYRDYLNGLIAWAEDSCIPLDKFDRRALRLYMLHRKEAVHPLTGKPLAESTRRHDVLCARRFTAFALDEGWIESDPLKGFPLPKAQKVAVKCPTIEEVQKLMEAIISRWDVRRNPKARYMRPEDRSFLRMRDYAIVCTILETGMRIGEVFALEFEDVILKGDKPRLIVTESKSNEPRECPITPTYINAISQWAALRENIRRKNRDQVKRAMDLHKPPPQSTDRWFCSTVQTPIDPGVFRRTFLAYLEYAGLERFTRHGIRHLFATIHANRNAVSAMHLLGHKRLQTTQGYVHEQQDRIRGDHASAGLLGSVIEGTERPPRPAGRKKKQVG